MTPKAGQYFAINRTPYKLVSVHDKYVVAEAFDSGMGTVFTLDKFRADAKFCTFAWAQTYNDGTYVLSEEEIPADVGVKQVIVIEL